MMRKQSAISCRPSARQRTAVAELMELGMVRNEELAECGGRIDALGPEAVNEAGQH